jgi:two-component system response regulator DctR
MSDLRSKQDIPCIAIIDDDPGVRASLGMLLETRGWRFAEFERAGDFLQDAAPSRFNCLVIDIRIPDMSGLELFEELNRRARSQQDYLPPALFLSAHGDIPLVVRVLKQGAGDFLEKPCDHRTMLDAVGRAIATDATARAEHRVQAELTKELAELTSRECEVLAEILEGYLSKQIADHLGISTKTVEAHRLRICQKLKVRTSMELAAKLRDVSPARWRKN